MYEEANNNDGAKGVRSWLVREERRWWAKGCAVSALSMLITRGYCWPQPAWLCWKNVRRRPERGRRENPIH